MNNEEESKTEETQRDTFIMFRSTVKAIERLPKPFQKAIAYKMICDYSLDNIEPISLDYIYQMIFEQAKPIIDSNRKRYDACVENGKKGGRPKKSETNNQIENQTNNQSKNQSKNQIENQSNNQTITKDITSEKPNHNLNVNVYDNVYVNDNVNENENANSFIKVSKKENINACTHAREETSTKNKNIISYEQVMEEMCVTNHALKSQLFEFIKHCQLNKRMLTNEKLRDIIVRLDISFKEDVDKIKAIRTAVSGGYFDIKT